MQTANETYLLEEEEWVVRVRPPNGAPAARPVLMLHGLQGNELVMWVFARALPAGAWLYAPRALLPAGDGFTWVQRETGLPALDDFSAPSARLVEALDRWLVRTAGARTAVDVIGFSQGAALAYALAALHPQVVARVVALAGFLPQADRADAYAALRGKPVYIAHGTKDETVPVRFAEQAAQILQASGARVEYCTSEIGHKLGANCMKGIETFLRSTQDDPL